MIKGLDSAFFIPSASQVAEAHADGVRVWGGYLATRGGVGLANPWTKADFDVVRAVGGIPIAYCSGQDDPTACKTLAAQWNVRLCLDVESGIRGDGSWVQAWLDASGAGLYGNAPVHLGRIAVFHVLAGYPGYNPGVVWPQDVPKPGTPLGWQWQGTHTEFGGSVDSTNFDDWFATTGSDDMLALEHKRNIVRAWYGYKLVRDPSSQVAEDVWANQIDDAGDNCEQIFSKFTAVAIANNDPNWNWYGKLKGDIAALQQGGTGDAALAARVQTLESEIAALKADLAKAAEDI